jgi:hypothetical protein
MLDRVAFVGPVRQCPTIQIYTTDRVVVVTRRAVLYVGNVLMTLKLFRRWKTVRSMVPNGFCNESPPFFQRKFPNTRVLANINESALKGSPLVPVPEFSVFSKASECFREGF